MKKHLARLAGIVLLTTYASVGFAQTAPIKLRFGHAHADTDSQHVAALEFAKKVKERTKGAIEIQVFGNNQLGNDGAMIAGEGRFLALRADAALSWSPAGYVGQLPRPTGVVSVLTPPASLAALAQGYRPLWHPSAHPAP